MAPIGDQLGVDLRSLGLSGTPWRLLGLSRGHLGLAGSHSGSVGGHWGLMVTSGGSVGGQ